MYSYILINGHAEILSTQNKFAHSQIIPGRKINLPDFLVWHESTELSTCLVRKIINLNSLEYYLHLQIKCQGTKSRYRSFKCHKLLISISLF